VIDRRVLPNGEVEEWERGPTIPDDFIYDPVDHSYYPPGEPTEWNSEVYEENVRRFFEERRNAPPIPRPQSRLPAGTLKGPSKRRKSLRVERGLLFDLSADEDSATAEQPSDVEDGEPS